LHVVSDALIALSYTTIPFTLAYFVRKRRDLPFTWMFQLFGIFIIACGATHAMAIWTLWNPTYRLSGVVKAITALASVPTAYLLVKLVPQGLTLPSPSAMQDANKRLFAAHVELAGANRQLAASNAELEAFSYSVAHDLRAPLRAMSGFSAILLNSGADRLDEEGRDCLQEITQNAERMGRLIDGLLALSRVTRTELRMESVNLSTMVQELCEGFIAEEPARKVELVVQPDIHAQTDADLVRALLENLVGNAWKFSQRNEHALIEFGERTQDGETVYFVRDNRAGFDQAFAQRMFTAFQRFHSQADFPGTGIGLATVQRIVRRHGGRVWAKGEIDVGSEFSFTLSGPSSEGAS